MVETIFEYSLKTIESMTKNVTTYVIAAIAILLLAACASPKNVAYIQNSEAFVADSSAFLYEAHIMPKDVLSITVSTINPEISAPFNLVISPTLGNASTGSQTVSSTRALQTYLVSNDGTISFPVLGTLKVGGLSKAECEKLIHDRIIRYLNGKEDPVVTVRMANYKISVLGEVARPGMFTVNNEKINIFEALAHRVKLIRENADGKKRIYTMNLNDANIINSPCYYLQQNDIVYVEPNKVKARNSSVGQTTTLWLTSTSILVSVASLLFNILK